MQKIWVTVLALALIFTLCACGNDKITTNNDLISSNNGSTNSYTSSSTPSAASGNPSTRPSNSSSKPSVSSKNESSEPVVNKFIPVGETFTLDGKNTPYHSLMILRATNLTLKNGKPVLNGHAAI